MRAMLVDTADRPGADSGSVREAELLQRLDDAFSLRFSDPDEGGRVAVELRVFAEREGLEHVEAVSIVVFAYCADIEDMPEDGLERLAAAFETCRRVGDKTNLMRAGDLLSTVFEGTGEIPEALRYAEVVLEVAKAEGSLLYVCSALSSLAGIFTTTGDLDAAGEKVEQALQIAEQLGSDRLRGRLHWRRGRILFSRRAYEQALDVFWISHALSQKVGSLFNECATLTEIGRVLEAMGRLEEAEAVLQRSLDLADSDVQQVVAPRTHVVLGRIYLSMGRLESAKDVLIKLENRSLRFNLLPTLAEGALLLAETYERLGQLEPSIGQYKRHIELRASAMEGETQRAVKRFQVQSELRAAQREAELERIRYTELETMQTQLVEAERMAAVGSLAAGIAHEMNSPLGVVKSGLNVADRAVSRAREALGPRLPPAAQAAFKALSQTRQSSGEALERLEALVASLRRFTRLDEAEVQTLDLVQSLDEALELLRPTLSEGIEVIRDITPLPRLEGWPSRMNQALLCLLMNAAEVQRGRGQILVQTRREGAEIVLHISDRGPGIPAEVRDRLFEISFDASGPRTRFRVGLATVRSVIQRHGGTIDFNTTEQGTTFTVRLPVIESGPTR